jgi:hypothetical protein
MAKAKLRYPEEIPFRLSGFDWIIKFIDIETENFGITDTDKKIIHIYYRDKDDQNVLETLLHELAHATLFDLGTAIFHFDSDKAYDKEENLILLTSPRIFAIIRDNPKLAEFILKRIKEL